MLKLDTDEKTGDRDEKKSECHENLDIELKYLNLAHFLTDQITTNRQLSASFSICFRSKLFNQ